MNRALKVYTELDSLYDYRRGLLQLLMTPNISDDALRKSTGDTLWLMHIEKNYKERRYDTFEHAFFNINREKFDALYDKRTISDWLMYYPSNFQRDFVKTLIDLEKLGDKPINIQTVELYVNCHPYILDDELKDMFVKHCTAAFKGLVSVKLVESDPSAHDASYYKQFNYVFKYDAIIGKGSKALMDSIKGYPIPDTAFVIPDILANKTDEFVGSNTDLIFSMSVTLGTVIKLVPIKHQFYDYGAE